MELEALGGAVPGLAFSISAFWQVVGDMPVADRDSIRSWQDLYLSRACLSRDEAAVCEFRARYQPRLMRVIQKVVGAYDADDVYQRVLTKLLVTDKPMLQRYRGRGSLQTWLGVVCANEAVDWLRSSARKRRLIDTLVDDVAADIEADDYVPLPKTKERLKAAIYQSIDELIPLEREILRHSKAGLTTIEIGHVMGVHRVTVSRHLTKLRTLLTATVAQVLESGEDTTMPLHRVLQHVTISIDRILGEPAQHAMAG